VRYIMDGEGLVQAEQVRFGVDIPQEKQKDGSCPRWLNLFARNDPATGFVRLQEFGEDAKNLPVPSTSKSHSTYWIDTRYVYHPYLALIAPGNAVFDKPMSPPPLKLQTSLTQDVLKILGKLLALVALVMAAITLGNWYFDTDLRDIADRLDESVQGWPLSWLISAPFYWLADWRKLFSGLPGRYLQWLLWLLYALLAWVVLALPTIFKLLWRRIEYRRYVPLGKGAYMNYWCNKLDKVGAIYTVALRKQGIWTVHDFLVAAVRPGGVQRLARTLHVSEEWVLERARQANLMRLGSVGPTQASQLLSAGIRSLEQLAQQGSVELPDEAVSFGIATGVQQDEAWQRQVAGWSKKAQKVKDLDLF
jgi:hypothetical protein